MAMQEFREEGFTSAPAPEPAAQRFSLGRLFNPTTRRGAGPAEGAIAWRVGDGDYVVLDAPYSGNFRVRPNPPSGAIIARSSTDAYYRLQAMGQLQGMSIDQWEEAVRGKLNGGDE